MKNLKKVQFKTSPKPWENIYPTTFSEYLKFSRFNDAFSDLKSKEVLPPPLIIQKERQIDYEKIASLEGERRILKFIQVLLANFHPKDLITFCNNLNSLKINPSGVEKDKITKYFAAYYDGENNAIFFKENRGYLYHELFHTSSCVPTNGIIYSGFRQYYYNGHYSLGSGLNEGYTELLTRRYFSQELFNTHPYNYLSHIASLVEIIVGEAKMQSLYLGSNLRGLIYELQKYNSKEEIINFLLMLDHLNSIVTFQEKIFGIKSQIQWYFNKIYEFLVKSYAAKLMNLYKEGQITRDRLDNLISEFISTFTGRCKFENVTFKTIRNDVLEHILQTTLERPDLCLQMEKVRKRKKK